MGFELIHCTNNQQPGIIWKFAKAVNFQCLQSISGSLCTEAMLNALCLLVCPGDRLRLTLCYQPSTLACSFLLKLTLATDLQCVWKEMADSAGFEGRSPFLICRTSLISQYRTNRNCEDTPPKNIPRLLSCKVHKKNKHKT